MAIELKVPEIGESITEVEIGDWLKNQGETVGKDEPVVTLESAKATVELPAPEAGTVSQVLKKKGDVAKVGEVIAYLEHNGEPVKEKKPGTAVKKDGAEKPAKEKKAEAGQAEGEPTTESKTGAKKE